MKNSSRPIIPETSKVTSVMPLSETGSDQARPPFVSWLLIFLTAVSQESQPPQWLPLPVMRFPTLPAALQSSARWNYY